MDEHGAIRLVYRVCAKVGDRSLRCGFVFFGGPPHSVVDGECGTILAHGRDYVVAITIKKAMPFGSAPNNGDRPPSCRTESMATSVQAPNSRSLSDCC